MEQANKINVYTCPFCGWQAVTRNLVEGTTPFLIHCEGLRCDAGRWPACQSSCYRVPQNLEPTHEWYKPTDDELMRKPWAIDHVALGGLLLRKVGDHEERAVGSR